MGDISRCYYLLETNQINLKYTISKPKKNKIEEEFIEHKFDYCLVQKLNELMLKHHYLIINYLLYFENLLK